MVGQLTKLAVLALLAVAAVAAPAHLRSFKLGVSFLFSPFLSALL